MSLYYDTAAVLESKKGSLKNRVYGSKDLKSPLASVYALAAEATKWAEVLKEVIENSKLLRAEKQLTPILALLLTHDLILSKNGIAARKDHPLNLAVSRHKTRLLGEFNRVRIRRGFATLEGLRNSLKAPSSCTAEGHRPRWIRINTILSSLAEELATTFEGFLKVDSLRPIRDPELRLAKLIYVDDNVRNLVAIPASHDFTSHPAYRQGRLIFQDKASCFPACLLNPQETDGDIIDACAAPGNKTTHLAALLDEESFLDDESFVVDEVNQKRLGRTIFACDRDGERLVTLSKMVAKAARGKNINILARQDFLELNPDQFEDVTALLLDPTCSGSGMFGRGDEDTDDTTTLPLPDPEITTPRPRLSKQQRRKVSRRRMGLEKETLAATRAHAPSPEAEAHEEEEEPTGEIPRSEALKERLKALSNFQLRLLEHAFSFPAATRITYSTCSLYPEENEHVVLRALDSDVAVRRGWRVMEREEQVEGMRTWGRRGLGEECGEYQEVAEACIRCAKGGEDGTMGFFVCGFVKAEGDTESTGVSDSSGETIDADADMAERDEEEDWQGSIEKWLGSQEDWQGFD
ncbi:MAG: hypothetical protein M1820_003556 [Bogoriella megaspora]|nr:MAG: hypothetical protein M1820_003556 [Bogoriella megaspora]